MPKIIKVAGQDKILWRAAVNIRGSALLTAAKSNKSLKCLSMCLSSVGVTYLSKLKSMLHDCMVISLLMKKLVKNS